MKIKSILILFFATMLTFGVSFAENETGADMLLKYGFISGNNGDTMSEKALTRAEAAVIMAEINGVKSEAGNYQGSSGFSDVSETMWYAPYIAYGKAHNYMGGYPDGSFKPEQAVTSKEFAALLMNAMGYQGDYTFEKVLVFAASKQVPVLVQGDSFVRGDAFEALWAAVNQPTKGTETPIGVKLGKIEGTVEQPVAVVEAAKLDDIVVSKNNRIEVKFTKDVDSTQNYTFKLTKYDEPISVKVYWNSGNTAVLSSVTPFSIGDYVVTVVKDGKAPGTSYNVKVESQKVGSINYDSDTIRRFDDFMGEIGYTVYDQYGENITNTTIGQRIKFYSSTSGSEAVSDPAAGVLLITHGNSSSSGDTLRYKDLVELIAIDDTTGFSVSQTLKVSQTASGIYSVAIKGVKDSQGNSTSLYYSTTNSYYLDLEILDEFGNEVLSKEVYDHKSAGNQDLLMVRCLNADLCTVVKTIDPRNQNQVAYQIVFNKAPDYDMDLFFNVMAPFAETSSNNASLLIKLKK